MRAVVALGGNAIIKKGEKETYSNLVNNIKKTCKHLIFLIKNYDITITFGNGSEIGFLALQNEIANKKVPEMPLDILGAESQGLIGYPLEEQLINELNKNKIRKSVVTILTQVLVDKSDKSFKNPTKFIGPFYSKKKAKKLMREFTIKRDSNRGYRRVVPSPFPLKIIEAETIKGLIKKNIVIAAGGGGIPVCKKKNILYGVQAVIDKDLASYVLARDIKAEYFFNLTGVDKVYLDYGTKNQKGLDKVNLKEIKKYYNQGHFPQGSMGPKILASIKFLEDGGKKVIITKPELIEKAIKGKAGTIITN